MHATARDDLLRLLRQRSSPCVSIYLPTHRSYPDRQQDAIRFRNLVDEAEQEVRKLTDTAQTQDLIQRFRGLMEDDIFWNNRLDGLAVLGSPDTFEVFDLQRPVPERAVVADSFHLKPLVRITQSADRFHVLSLQREAVWLFEGNRDHLDLVEPDGVPLTAHGALTAVSPPAPGQADSRGGNPPRGLAAAVGDAKMDVDRFFRIVDQAIFEHLSRDSGAPLVLAGLPEEQAIFRSVSRNPHLVPDGIPRGTPAQIDEQFLHDAWKCVEPHYLKRLEQIVNDFRIAQARGMASDDLHKVAQAISRDRVGILMIEAERMIPGRFVTQTGQIIQDEENDMANDDLLDDFAEIVLQTDGTAIVVPKDRMPSTTGLAAIYRF